MALFPRRIAGRYAALSRWDRESNAIGYSDDGRRWGEARTVQAPAQPWELIQLGNCGSPIETPAGWLVFTHGVGPMREYAIGAVLLDLDEPERLMAALSEPLLVADESEREGYVPNVVYSCGSMMHGENSRAALRLQRLLGADRHRRPRRAARPAHTCLSSLQGGGPGMADQLPSWTDGQAKAQILEFVRSVTEPGDSFVAGAGSGRGVRQRRDVVVREADVRAGRFSAAALEGDGPGPSRPGQEAAVEGRDRG